MSAAVSVLLLAAPFAAAAHQDKQDSAALNPNEDPFTLVQPSADVVAARVDKHYNSVHGLELSFVERYTGAGIERNEQGRLLLKKPGLMRWEYSRPHGKLFLIDKHFAYSYTPGDAQVQRIPVEKLNDLRSPLRFLLGKTNLAKELDKLTVTYDGGMAILRGVPVGMEKTVSQLELTVLPSGTILSMRMQEIGGAETRFQFYNENDKVDINKDVFVFTPPANVKVVDGLPPM
jgi:outer membrane lipoprotein carrier protein